MTAARPLLALLTAAVFAPAAWAADPAPYLTVIDPAAPRESDVGRCAAVTWLVGRAAREAPSETRQTLAFLQEAFLVVLDERAIAAGAAVPDAQDGPLAASRAAVEEAARRYAATVRAEVYPGGHAAADPFLKAELAACGEVLDREGGQLGGSDGAEAR